MLVTLLLCYMWYKYGNLNCDKMCTVFNMVLLSTSYLNNEFLGMMYPKSAESAYNFNQQRNNMFIDFKDKLATFCSFVCLC